MKVKFTKLAALLLAGVALLASGCTDYEKDIQEANAKIDQLNGNIADANQQIAALQQALNSLKDAHTADVSKLNKAISDLEAALRGEIANLEAALDKKLDKTTFEAAKEEIKKSIDGVSDRVKALEDANFQAQIDGLKKKVEDLDAEKASKEDLQKAVADLTALISGEVAKLNEKIAANEAAIKKINEETIPAINAQIEDLQKNKVDKADYDKFVEETSETLRLLNDAVEELAETCATKQELKDEVDKIMKKLDDYVLKTDLAKTLEAYATKADLNAVKAELSGRLDALEALTDGFPEGTTIKKYIDALATKVENAIKEINANITKLDERVTALEEGLTEANQNIEALQTAVDEINDSLDTIKKDLLSVKASIRSLVFVPEVYVDGVEAILIQSLKYAPLELIDKDTEDEVAEEAEDSITVSPKVIAKYHVIPSNADLSFLTPGESEVNFVIRPNDPFKTIRTRAEASEDFNVTGVYMGLDEEEEDVIKIEVTVEGTPATDKLISVVALQLTNAGEMYTSDYATVFSEKLDSLRIAMPQMEEDADYHYRRATEAIAALDDEAGISDLAVYTEDLNIESCDTTLVYDKEKKYAEQVLEDITEAHVIAEGEDGCVIIDPKKLELNWLFELVDIEDWAVGALDEISLVENEDESHSIKATIDAMDLTPVVRASLVSEDEENAQIAYIKFYVAPQDFDSTVEMGEFTFSCEGDSLQTEEINIYQQLGMTKETFERVYPNFMTEDPDAVAEDEAEAEEEAEEEEGDAEQDEDEQEGEAEEEEEEEAPEFEVTFDPETGILQWKGYAEWLWNNAVDEDEYDENVEPLTTEVYFVNPNNGAKITVTLKAMPPMIQAYKIDTSHYIEEYWNDDLSAAKYNVAQPGFGVDDSTKCVFHNNINAAFETVDTTGVIDLSDIGQEGLEVSNINYFFCEHMMYPEACDQLDLEDLTEADKGPRMIGDFEVTFTVEDGEGSYEDVNGVTFDYTGTNTVLKAQIGDEEPVDIAYICNTATEKKFTPNVVVLVKDPDPMHLAKQLLNTNKLYILLGATGMICGDEGFEVNLLWQSEPEKGGKWLDHFRANYRQPVEVAGVAQDYFIDAVDFGRDGSYITLKDLIAPVDWRGYAFGMNQGDENYNYWGFYGVIKVNVNTKAITCSLTDDGKVPVTVDLDTMDKEQLKGELKVDEPMRNNDGTIMTDKDGNEITVGDYIDSIDDGDYGFLVYRNNGTVVKDFDLYVPVTVQYGWGIITTEEPITVHVYGTVNNVPNAD